MASATYRTPSYSRRKSSNATPQAMSRAALSGWTAPRCQLAALEPRPPPTVDRGGYHSFTASTQHQVHGGVGQQRSSAASAKACSWIFGLTDKSHAWSPIHIVLWCVDEYRRALPRALPSVADYRIPAVCRSSWVSCSALLCVHRTQLCGPMARRQPTGFNDKT